MTEPANVPLIRTAPGDTPCTTDPDTVAADVAFETKVEDDVTVYTAVFVRVTEAVSARRWYADVHW